MEYPVDAAWQGFNERDIERSENFPHNSIYAMMCERILKHEDTVKALRARHHFHTSSDPFVNQIIRKLKQLNNGDGAWS